MPKKPTRVASTRPPKKMNGTGSKNRTLMDRARGKSASKKTSRKTKKA